ncbi:K-stimulated pyrophosphate-energized sodium pump protein [Perilla frutescens var. frutescens]|nr:K-stimulated pyrophosphate-energized sodium pump protein [Perilla frutescens var. frutescens]
MPPALTPRASAYLGAVALQIEKKLQRALTSPSQSRSLLKELFADIALEVDDRAKADIIFDEEDVVYAAEDRYGCAVCFYDVLADYFVCMPQNGKSIIDLVVQLWSQSFASNIFCLLFHKRMFEVQFDNPEVVLRYSSALVQGAGNVFWIDIQTNARRFLSLFHYLLEEVAFHSERLKKISPQAQRDLFLLLSRFLFFYDSADKLETFLKQFPDFPNAFLIGGAQDIFVTEIADQLQKLKVEPVLLDYLSHIDALQGLELRVATSTRLKACLYSFTSPGGPMYPTRAVRHAAWDALNFLFPVRLFFTFTMIAMIFRFFSEAEFGT